MQDEHDLTIHADSRQAAAALHALLEQMYKLQLPTTLLQLTWLLIAADTYDCPTLMEEIQGELDKLLNEQAELDRLQQNREEAGPNQEVAEEQAVAPDDGHGEDEQPLQQQQAQEQQQQEGGEQPQQQREQEPQQEQKLEELQQNLPDQQQGHLNWDVVHEVYQVSLSYPQYMQKDQGLLWPLWKACTHWVSCSK